MKQRLYIALHLFLMIYSVSGVVSKLAAGKPFIIGGIVVYSVLG